MATGNAKIDHYVEAMCSRGCHAVDACIESLLAGHKLSEYADLSDLELTLLCKELEDVMRVYNLR